MSKKKIKRTSIWYSHAITNSRCPSCKKWATALMLIVWPDDYTLKCPHCNQEYGLIKRSGKHVKNATQRKGKAKRQPALQ